MEETLELTIESKNRQASLDLTDWLDQLGQPYVSSCVTEDERDEWIVKAWLDDTAWQALPSWPVSVYFDSESTLAVFVEDLETWLDQNEARHLFSVDVKKIPSKIWQRAWESVDSDFETEHFWIHIKGFASIVSEKTKLVIDPGKAFGSGQHATTKASLLLLESLEVGDSVLDVGTGTGILAIAAEKLGYGRVLATDIDPDAWLSAECNRKLNKAKFQLLKDSLPVGEERFSLVLCNILPPVVNNMLPDLVRLMKPVGGRLLIAGVHLANVDLIKQAAADLGLIQEAEHDERGWLALCFSLSSFQ